LLKIKDRRLSSDNCWSWTAVWTNSFA